MLELTGWKAITDNGNTSAHQKQRLQLGVGGMQLGHQGLLTKLLQSHYDTRMRTERQFKLRAQSQCSGSLFNYNAYPTS